MPAWLFIFTELPLKFPFFAYQLVTSLFPILRIPAGASDLLDGVIVSRDTFLQLFDSLLFRIDPITLLLGLPNRFASACFILSSLAGSICVGDCLRLLP